MRFTRLHKRQDGSRFYAQSLGRPAPFGFSEILPHPSSQFPLLPEQLTSLSSNQNKVGKKYSTHICEVTGAFCDVKLQAQ